VQSINSGFGSGIMAGDTGILLNNRMSYWHLDLIERRLPEAVRSELARRGHPVKVVGDLDGPCSVEIIRRDAASGMLLAGSDPRRDGWALAW
jgi:gamma-glutamyltranspeptidase